MTSPAPVAPVMPVLTPDTDEPSWLVHLIAVLVAAVPIALAVWQPGHVNLTSAAQATIIGIGLAGVAIFYAVRTLAKNGLSKAGLTKTVTEEEAWLHANATTIRNVFEQAKPALEALPAAQNLVDEAQLRLQETITKAGDTNLDNLQTAIKAALPTLVHPWALTDGTPTGATPPPPGIPAVAADAPASQPAQAAPVAEAPAAPAS